MHATENGRFDLAVDDNQQDLIGWLNDVLPHLNLPLDASVEELKECLIDGSVLLSVLNRLSPGSVVMGVGSESHLENVSYFLSAIDDMGLPGFHPFDLEQGSISAVLKCLKTLRTHFHMERENLQNNSMICNLSEDEFLENIDCSHEDLTVASVASNGLINYFEQKFHDVFQMKQGCHTDLAASKILESMKLNSFDNAPTHSLFNIVNKILDDNIERKNEDVHCVARLLKKFVQVIEGRVSNQLGHLRKQNGLYKTREEKYQSRIRMLEVIATGTTKEIDVVMNQLQRIKIEKIKIEEDKKHDKLDMERLNKENSTSVEKISALKQEVEMLKGTHEKHYLILEERAHESKVILEKKSMELEFLLSKSKKENKELAARYEIMSRGWKNKELKYLNFIKFQYDVLKELRVASQSIKQEVLKGQRNYSKELNHLGLNLKGLADAAGNYHVVLAENRKLYNEVQDLKGNIRVYCRIRPFLPGESKKQTSVEYAGENGELVVANPLKMGKDNHKLFKFNKVFGPTTTQEEVFLDTQPLIRSVLDGYNVCIFAYGQTGSGKTYTMTGPDMSSKEDWGVNYRALNDLFNISQSRKGSIMYEVGVQMVEIYNEQVRDLLLSSDGPQKRLEIWTSAQPNGLAVPDASMHPVNSTKDVLELMGVGLMNRVVGATALNDRSSRSHSVLTVHVRGMDLDTDAVLRGSLHLVDLAGSERVDRSEATGERLREAQHINKSLSALGDVIYALSKKSSHVPYRNSKLTQVLQGSLGGQAKTLMFVQLNPDVESYSETVSTLKFAERVSGVELGAAQSNKEGRDVRGLMEQVASLKETVAKREEEIELLHKVNASGGKHGMNTIKNGYSSRRHSLGGTQQIRRHLKGKTAGLIKKAASEVDICSEQSDMHSEEANSQQSIDEVRHQNEALQRPKISGGESGQNLIDDIELFGFGDADSEERLSDISDGELSMGTETDGSFNSIVEFTLFPKTGKQTENLYKSSASVPSKLPRPPQKQVQTRTSQLSLTKSTSMLARSKKTIVSSSSIKPLKRWQ